VIAFEDVMARTDDGVRHASSYWLITAHAALTSAAAHSPLTPEQRRRLRLIVAEMRDRDILVPE
jgi:hypothetical protein